MWFPLLAIGAIAALGLFAYSYAADSGILGDRERERYLQQSGGTVGLLQARGEFASAILAVSDSPILGHGSYALDTNEYRSKGAEILGLIVTPNMARSDRLIPGHSHIWQFWIWHGLLGGIFWIYVLIFVVRFLKSYLLMEPEYLAVLLLICLGFCWNILFSPFGGRPAAAANLAILILIYQRHRSSTSQPEPRHGTLSTWRSQ